MQVSDEKKLMAAKEITIAVLNEIGQMYQISGNDLKTVELGEQALVVLEKTYRKIQELVPN